MDNKQFEQIPIKYAEVFDVKKLMKIIHEHNKTNIIKLSVWGYATKAIKEWCFGKSFNFEYEDAYLNVSGFLNLRCLYIGQIIPKFIKNFETQNKPEHVKIELMKVPESHRNYEFWDDVNFTEYINKHINLYNQSNLTKQDLIDFNEFYKYVIHHMTLFLTLAHYEHEDSR